MDPVSAAGFASSIITFIDFSFKLIQGSVTLYQSSTGATVENAKISSIVDELKDVTDAIAHPPTPQANGSHWPELRKLALECHAVSTELADMLETLKRKDDNKAWRSFECAWKSMRKSKEIAALEQRLNTYRVQLLLRTNLILSDSQASIKRQLDGVRKSDVTFFEQTIRELTNVQRSIADLEDKLMAEATQSMRVLRDEAQDAVHLGDLRVELLSVVRSLEAIPKRTPADLQVLNRLHFGSLHSRVDTIGNAEFGTFSWFLEKDAASSSNDVPEQVAEMTTHDDNQGDTSDDDNASWSSYDSHEERSSTSESVHLELSYQALAARKAFQAWLTSGSGVFHISGKAGSGKSTIMKFLCQHQGLKDRLSSWAGEKNLVFASFFFWMSGDDQQHSLEGLYRSLLFEVLNQRPDLAMTAFPDFCREAQAPYAERVAWNQSPFRLPELRQAMNNLISCHSGHQKHRFCFFVDGLDEFQGDSSDHWQLARLLRRWTESPDVKLCVSSRPHQEFFDVFDTDQRLHLHELTEHDIQHFVSGALSQEPVDHVDPEFRRNAIFEVTRKAEGVFLWACLVVRSLLEGIRRRDSRRRLDERIAKAPGDLEALFRQLFEGISPSDRYRADQMIVLVATYGALPLLMLSWLEDLDDPDFPFEKAGCLITPEETLCRHTSAEAQMKSICRGLLEESLAATDMTNDDTLSHVNFLHKTARDFFLQPQVFSEMARRLEGRFEVHDAMQRLRLAYFKSVYFSLDSMDRVLTFVLSEGAAPPRLLSAYATELCRKQQEMFPPRNLSWGKYLNPWTAESTEFLIQDTDPAPGRRPLLYMAAFYGQREYVVEETQKMKNILGEEDGLCLLLSACVGACYSFKFRPYSSQISLDYEKLVRDLIAAGKSMDCPIVCGLNQAGVPVTVPGWAAFLYCIASRYAHDLSLPGKHSSYNSLWMLLEVVLDIIPELDVGFEFARNVRHERLQRYVFDDQSPSFSVSLRQLMMWTKPPNMDVLLGEMVRRKAEGGWFLSRLVSSLVAPTVDSNDLDMVVEFMETASRLSAGKLGGYRIRRMWAGKDTSWEFDPYNGFRVW